MTSLRGEDAEFMAVLDAKHGQEVKALRVAPSPLRQRGCTQALPLRKKLPAQLELHRNRLLGRPSSQERPNIAFVQRLVDSRAQLWLGSCFRAWTQRTFGEASEPPQQSGAAKAGCALLRRYQFRSQSRAVFSSWRLLICWAKAEQRFACVRDRLWQVQSRALRTMLRQRRQAVWELCWLICRAWHHEVWQRNISPDRRMTRESSAKLAVETAKTQSLRQTLLRYLGTSRRKVDEALISRSLAAWLAVTALAAAAHTARVASTLRQQQVSMAFASRALFAWSAVVSRDVEARHIHRQLVAEMQHRRHEAIQHFTRCALLFWRFACGSQFQEGIFRLSSKHQTLQANDSLLLSVVHRWASAASKVVSERKAAIAEADSRRWKAESIVRNRAFHFWVMEAFESKLEAIHSLPATFLKGLTLAARAMAAWMTAAVREAAYRAIVRSQARANEATLAITVAESRLLEVASAESRLSRARAEVHVQVEAMRCAMSAGMPIFMLQRALLVWRCYINWQKQEISETSILVSPGTPKPRPDVLDVFTMQRVKLEAARQVEVAERALEAAEKAALLNSVVRAWSKYSTAAQAERWHRLVQDQQIEGVNHTRTIETKSVHLQ